MNSKEPDHSSYHSEKDLTENTHEAPDGQDRKSLTSMHHSPAEAGEQMDHAVMGREGMIHDEKSHAGIEHADIGHATMDHEALGHEAHAGGEGHAAHVDHTGHEEMFRQRFWVSLALSIPVLLYSPTVQQLLGFSMPAFPGSQWIEPVFSVIVFLYGGLPFLQMAVPEIRNRQPGMMTLISLAISVAFIYSVAVLFLPGGASGPSMGFFWELVTLIDIMLLGHWLEMRSVRQASGALDELARLMPDTGIQAAQRRPGAGAARGFYPCGRGSSGRGFGCK
jgi:Cu2+-exporting ATPase